MGASVSMPTAIAHSARRVLASAKAPAIQNGQLIQVPDRDAQEVAPVVAVVAPQRPQHEEVAPDLHCQIGEREHGAAVVERARDRGRDHQGGEHHREQEKPYRRTVRVEPVGDPGGIDPLPPHRHHQHGDLHRADRGEVLEQPVRKLRHREHENEIEEQLDIGDARVPAAAVSQMVLARRKHRCRHSG